MFSFSVTLRVAGGLFLLADSLVIGLYVLSVRPLFVLFAIFMFSGVVGGALSVYQSLTLQVRSAEFYEDGFKVKGRNLKREHYTYSDVKDVVLVKAPWPNTTLTILLKGKQDGGGDDVLEESITITKNPVSSYLDVDLYSWLKEKIADLRERAT